MTLEPTVQWIAFTILSLISIAGALGMATTMSMFRSGIFLMGSFIGVAGLFILLLADLLALLQIMMYIGGMLIMVLYMVLFSHDPGGAMMADMDMSIIEKFFTLGIKSSGMDMGGGGDDEGEGGKEEESGEEEGGEGDSEEESEESSEEENGQHQVHAIHTQQSDGQQEEEENSDEKHQQHGQEASGGEQEDQQDSGEEEGEQEEENGGDEEDEGHGGMDMSMTTPIKKPAAIVATIIGIVMVILLLMRPVWPIMDAAPATDSARKVGNLLMGKYMMAFEGAGLLILIGIFGAVLVSRPGRFPDREERDAYVAVDEMPPPVDDDALKPTSNTLSSDAVSVLDVHKDGRN